MKRLGLLFLLLFFSAGMIFAGGEQEGEGSEGAKHLTISVSNRNANKDYENDLTYQWVKEEFNVDFEFYGVSQADWQEKLQIWVASGDMPDVMVWDFKYHHMPQYNDWVEMGALRALPDDLSDYPNLVEGVLDNMLTDDYLMIDGKRYAIPHNRSSAFVPGGDFEYVWEAAHTCYRRDWAKKLGLYKENDIYTWEEAMDMTKAFIEQDPGNNGKGKTIGYVMAGYGFTQGFTGILQNFSDYPGYREGYVLKDGEYVWAASLPGMIDGLKAFRRIVDEGILWSDQPAAKGSVGMDRYYAGEAGMSMIYYSKGQIAKDRLTMMELHDMSVEEVRDALAPMHIERENGSLFALPLDDYWSISIFSKKMSDEKMDRWLQMSDWLSTTEGYLNYYYGPEGKGWEFDDNGELNVLWELNEEGTGYVTPEWNVQGWTEGWSRRWVDAYSLIPSTDPRLEATKTNDDSAAFLEQYDGRIYGYTEPDPYVKFFTGPNFNKYGNFFNEIHEAAVTLVYSDTPIDQFEAEWNKFVESKMPQVQLVLDELNDGLE
ncbi:MAG: extracellular solute-binding protein [Spirochaetia bacterium]